MGSISPAAHHIDWRTDVLDVKFVQNADGVMCIRSVVPAGSVAPDPISPFFGNHDMPLVSVRFAAEGNTITKTAKALVGSYASERLKYISHEMKSDSAADTLTIYNEDEITGTQVKVNLLIYKGIPVLRATATITIFRANSDVIVTQLSPLTIGGLTTGSREWSKDYTLLTATNTWFREAQWQEHKLPDIGIDANGIYGLPEGHVASLATFGLSNRGSFSTCAHLPMGILRNNRGDDTWLWSVENNGSWRWEIGDCKDSIYFSATGPTSVDHGWKRLLRSGESFTTPPVTCCRVRGTTEDAFAAMTSYRRAMRRPHFDMEKLPIIFNDYMNCLMGDPDESKILALLDPVARAGAEYFVIDAGWYADDSNWWDDVGLWEPSKKRFPSGFKNLLKKIRKRGLVPGLWLEPEVVGVRSIVGKQLPEDAFFQESGQRVVERGRYQLDFRCDRVREWMSSVIRRLVLQYDVGYFKFDYNIEVVYGTDKDGVAPGVASLEHQRAYLDWVRHLLDSYPNLVIENCSSGAQRMEYAMLGVHSLQSTSDQQDPALYAAIAAAVPTAVAPEQSASWAYPQRNWSDEINALTVINSLLGRVHLSGHLDQLSEDQFDLVVEGMHVYKSIRYDLRNAHAVWPLGLPKWHDDWISLGMVSKEDVLYLSVWRRGGSTKIDLPLPLFKGKKSASTQLLYPATFEAKHSWNSDEGVLKVELPATTCARLFCIR